MNRGFRLLHPLLFLVKGGQVNEHWTGAQVGEGSKQATRLNTLKSVEVRNKSTKTVPTRYQLVPVHEFLTIVT